VADKHGIRIEMIDFPRGLQAMQALTAGEVDVSVGGLEAGVTGAASGAPTVIVSGVAAGGISWQGRSDLSWKSLADLKGRKFGSVRGIHDLVMRVVFEQNGLTYSTRPGEADVQVFYLPSAMALINALQAKQIDAMTNAEPFASRASAQGFGVEILRPYNTPLGNIPRGVFMHKNFLERNPAAAQRFVNALVEATKKLRDDPRLAREFALRGPLKGKITEADWDLAAKNQAFDVNLTLGVIQAHADYMAKYGMIKAPVKAADFTRLEMLETAKKELGW
jgi:NitT/TauT family transport system substrate-binding protein